jgi:hypothetical protein
MEAANIIFLLKDYFNKKEKNGRRDLKNKTKEKNEVMK